MADLKLLQAGASELGVELTREQLSAFSLYMNEMLRSNRRANLTAITAPDQIQTKHFLDSLSCLLAFPGAQAPRNAGVDARSLSLTDRLKQGAGLACIDVGTGAGFPGLPLKICLPEMKLTLVDSVGKKTAFLSRMVELLKLEGVRVITARSEELAHDPAEREQYQVAVARAVSMVAVVAELCLPFCSIGGRTIAPKKGDIAQEIEEGRYAVQAMGGSYGEVIPVRVSLLEDDRVLVVMNKRAPTPKQYPRRAGMPAKRPLLLPSGARHPSGQALPGSAGVSPAAGRACPRPATVAAETAALPGGEPQSAPPVWGEGDDVP